jgi:hypothetical protein
VEIPHLDSNLKVSCLLNGQQWDQLIVSVAATHPAAGYDGVMIGASAGSSPVTFQIPRLGWNAGFGREPFLVKQRTSYESTGANSGTV